MAEFAFEDLEFEDKKSKIGIHFLRLFYTEIEKTELEQIGKFKISKHAIKFDTSEIKANKRFNFILSNSFKNLKNKLTGQKAVYIHQNSGIPLLGHNAFGLIDRNTSIIEVRPITGCNLDCIYCSVTQKYRPIDFVVEKDYLISEFKKLVKHKGIKDIEAHIGTQGEPLLYAPLADLIKDLSAIPEVSVIALDTNGTLLTKQKVDELIAAGLTRFCFSINSLDQPLAEKIASKPYNLTHILDIISYISKQQPKVQLILTPVWIPKINDDEIPKLIELSKKLSCGIGIQNFLNYKYGLNPAKQMSWEEFIEKMKQLEKQHNAHLLFDFKKDFNVRTTKPLPKPFKKGDIIKAKLMLPGRLKKEMIAVAQGRTIAVYNCSKPINSEVKLKLTRSKHNIFTAVEV